MRSIVTVACAVALVSTAAASQERITVEEANKIIREAREAGLPDQPDWTWKIHGPARVIDGDTLEIHGAVIRLAASPSGTNIGLDAPEMGQACITSEGVPWGCGVAARAVLVDMIDGDDVTCFGMSDSKDRWGRFLAVCHVWPRVNLSAQIVRMGYAIAYRWRGAGRYEPIYGWAADKRIGIWNSRFEWPWEWRRKKRPPT